MAFTAGLTSGLTEPITKTLLDDYFYGGLTLEELVALLGSTLWLDATETYAKSKVAVSVAGTGTRFEHPTMLDFERTDSFSIKFVFRGGSTGNYSNIGKIKESSPFNGWMIRTISTNKIEFFLVNTLTTNAIQVNFQCTNLAVYTDIVITYDGSSNANNVKCYENSVDISSSISITSNNLSASTSNAFQFNIGDQNSSGLADFNGVIDQLIAFNKELTSTEVSTLYNSGDGLQHKDLDGTETFYNNIVAWYDFNTPPNFGRNYAEESHAVSLDGSADYFKSSSSAFAFTDTTLLSVGGWVYPTASTVGVIFSKLTNATIIGWEVYQYPTTRELTFFMNGGGGLIHVQSSTVLQLNTWQHVAVKYDGSRAASGVQFYINGSPVGQLPPISDTAPTIASVTADFNIGSFDNVGAKWTGRVDEAFYYSDCLTDGEVATLYNGGTVAPARTLLPVGNSATLISDWSFNAQNVTDIGKDSYGSNDLTPNSIAEPDLVGGKDSLDLLEVNITSANVTDGHIEGKAAGYDGVTKWLDRSGNGNDVSQSTLADCPYFDAATNSIIFTGTQNLVTSGNIGLTGDFTIFEVKAYSDVTEVVDTVGINGNLIRNIGSGSERNVWSTTPDNNSTRLVNNTFAITAQNLEDGVSGNFWTNGVKDDAFSDTTMVRTDGPLKINQDTGIVGELRYKAVLYWNRKLTDSEMATVFEYLNDLYGVY